jgi:RecB family endonuclease NucS
VTSDIDPPATLVAPDADRALALVEAALDDGFLVTLAGRCTVEHADGSDASASTGDLLVLAKPDGTLLAHAAEGYQPVAWQPTGGAFDAYADDASLVLDGDDLTVTFDAIQFVAATDAGEERTVRRNRATEADLRERVLADPDLVEPGFEPRATERETPAGPVDVYGADAHGTPVAVELKASRVGPDAVGQLARYVDALEADLHADADVRGMLVAPSVTDRARRRLAERGLTFSQVSPRRDA